MKKNIRQLLTSPGFVLCIYIIFFLVGVAGHVYTPTFPLMMTLTPFVLLVFGLGSMAFPVAEIKKRGQLKIFLIWGVLTYGLTFALEAIGSATGLIFGAYWYEETLGFSFLGVPLVIGFNWTLIVLALSAFLSEKIPNIFLSALATGIGAMVFDYIMEPIAIAFNYWEWEGGDIPIQNYIAWFIIATVFSIFYRLCKIELRSRFLLAYVGIQACFFLLLQLFAL